MAGLRPGRVARRIRFTARGLPTQEFSRQITFADPLAPVLREDEAAHRFACYTYGSEGWGFESLRAHKNSCGSIPSTNPPLSLLDSVTGDGARD